MLVVNASNIDKDFEWLQKHLTGMRRAHEHVRRNAAARVAGTGRGTILAKDHRCARRPARKLSAFCRMLKVGGYQRGLAVPHRIYR